MYSAVSVQGRGSTPLERRGLTVEREKRPVTVAALTLSVTTRAPGGARFLSIVPGDICPYALRGYGEALGAYGVMTSPATRGACGFSLSDAVSLEEARALGEAGRLGERIRPVDLPVPWVPAGDGFLEAGGALPKRRRAGS